MKVIIGGAGITGLAVGCYLQKKGIDFQILEQSVKPQYLTTGIQLASNCHFVFSELNLYDLVKEKSIERKSLDVYADNNKLNELSTKNFDDTGTFFIRRSDLITIFKSSISADKIFHSKAISNVEQNDRNVSLLIDGEEHKCDLFLDCMGANSITTKNATKTSSKAIWGISTYTDILFQSFNNFMYENMHFVTYPLTQNETAFTLVLNTDKLSIDLKNIDIRDLDSILNYKFTNLINNAGPLVVKDIYTSETNNWGKGQIISLGDSAHAITPHLAQGAAQGLIDAAFFNQSKDCNIFLNDAFQNRNKLINKIRSESKLNKQRYQMGMPAKLFRNLYLKLYKPNYNWLFNSKYEIKCKSQ